jgi:hypothetical protein
MNLKKTRHGTTAVLIAALAALSTSGSFGTYLNDWEYHDPIFCTSGCCTDPHEDDLYECVKEGETVFQYPAMYCAGQYDEYHAQSAWTCAEPRDAEDWWEPHAQQVFDGYCEGQVDCDLVYYVSCSERLTWKGYMPNYGVGCNTWVMDWDTPCEEEE